MIPIDPNAKAIRNDAPKMGCVGSPNGWDSYDFRPKSEPSPPAALPAPSYGAHEYAHATRAATAAIDAATGLVEYKTQTVGEARPGGCIYRQELVRLSDDAILASLSTGGVVTWADRNIFTAKQRIAIRKALAEEASRWRKHSRAQAQAEANRPPLRRGLRYHNVPIYEVDDLRPTPLPDPCPIGTPGCTCYSAFTPSCTPRRSRRVE